MGTDTFPIFHLCQQFCAALQHKGAAQTQMHMFPLLPPQGTKGLQIVN